jgi:hypothetical protein
MWLPQNNPSKLKMKIAFFLLCVVVKVSYPQVPLGIVKETFFHQVVAYTVYTYVFAAWAYVLSRLHLHSSQLSGRRHLHFG